MAKNGFSMSNRTSVRTISTAEATLTADDCGKIIILDRAAGSQVQLPSSPTVAGAGWNVTVIVKTSVTSNAYSIDGTASADFFIGGIASISSAGAKSDLFIPNGSSHNSIQMNGTTKGGLKGTRITFISDGTQWHINGTLACSGTPLDPFDAIV